jgi:hypothetical protein
MHRRSFIYYLHRGHRNVWRASTYIPEEQLHDWREVLPYGAYVEKDGALVYFDRAYNPLFRIASTNAYRAHVDPATCIDYVNQIWFYDDGCMPKYNKAVRERLYKMISNFKREEDKRDARQ